MIKIFINKVQRKRRNKFNKYKNSFNYWNKYWKWRYRIKYGRRIGLSNDTHKAIVIINSYNRAKNIEHIIRAVLKCDFVDKVIVSNNNPQVKIGDWVKIKNRRVILIDQKFRKRCRYRWVIAVKNPCQYYIAIDDDVFVYPEQLMNLFESLIQDPGVPHGMFGSVYNSLNLKNDQKLLDSAYVKYRDQPVDVLHQIYAATSLHVANYLNLLTNLKIHNHQVSNILRNVGDDIVISHAGSDFPKIHDLGFVIECPTRQIAGVSTFQKPGFYERRSWIFREVRKAALRLHWSN